MTTNFYSTEFVSINLLTEKETIEQITSAIEDFKNKTIATFKQSLNLIIDSTLGNQFMSIYETNLYFISNPNGSNRRSYSEYRFLFCRFHFRWI